MAFVDYYKILGVDRNIPQKDVRRAYLKRTKQFHPDLHPDDPKAKAKFQALTEAYEVINDPEKRSKYDRYGEQWRNADSFSHHHGSGYSGGGSPFDGFDFSGFSGSGGGFSSFFEDLFGRPGRATGADSWVSGARKGSGDVTVVVDIDLYTAMLGGDVVLQLNDGTKIRLKVKAETQNGTKVRVKGKGNNRGLGPAGDLIITYNIVLPTNLSSRQKELLRQMRNG